VRYKTLKCFELTGKDGKPFDVFNPTERRIVKVGELLELGKDINKSTAEVLIKLGKIKED